jgi:hypothetical protein
VKIKMFNGSTSVQDLKLIAGGFDPESGRLTFIVTGEEHEAGTVALSVGDTDIIKTALDQAPEVRRVEGITA